MIRGTVITITVLYCLVILFYSLKLRNNKKIIHTKTKNPNMINEKSHNFKNSKEKMVDNKDQKNENKGISSSINSSEINNNNNTMNMIMYDSIYADSEESVSDSDTKSISSDKSVDSYHNTSIIH